MSSHKYWRLCPFSGINSHNRFSGIPVVLQCSFLRFILSPGCSSLTSHRHIRSQVSIFQNLCSKLTVPFHFLHWSRFPRCDGCSLPRSSKEGENSSDPCKPVFWRTRIKASSQKQIHPMPIRRIGVSLLEVRKPCSLMLGFNSALYVEGVEIRALTLSFHPTIDRRPGILPGRLFCWQNSSKWFLEIEQSRGWAESERIKSEN
jgi:hypothetical protein